MNIIELPCEVAGLYKIESFKADAAGVEIPGSRRVLADWFPNLITNNGLNLIGGDSNWLMHCQVGSGSTPPSFTDTALASRIANSSTVSAQTTGAQASAPYFAWRRKIFRFAAGVATGNIAEVGIGPAAAGDLLSRALILDGSGNPTTITVQSDEILDVAYEFRYYAPTVDGSGSIVLAGVTYAYTSRAAFANSATYWNIQSNGTPGGTTNFTSLFTGAIGTIIQGPSGTSAVGSTSSPLSYSANSYYRDIKLDWALSQGNVAGGARSFMSSLGIGAYQFEFSPVIPKDNTKTLSLTFRHSWSRRP